ncbi:MAG: ATP-binding protein [Chloroflexi bacterium]|nr:ATP-binding protein [Chloroflexota bacterium]
MESRSNHRGWEKTFGNRLMSEPRKLTPAEEARLAQVREQFKQKQEISKSLNSIKHRIGVYSGKGGVGKTTVTTNLAISLAKKGKKVAILDCDIDCPNVTRVLRISNRPEADAEGKMIPPEKYGVSVMSMGFFQENEDEAIVWRGPMIHNAINQFISKTNWGDIDYLICDLPPGTSDAPLTVMQTLNIDGFIVVSTPQELAALDAKRSINMIKKLNLKVWGVVENMTGGIFGTGGAKDMADELGLPTLTEISLLADYSDNNEPAVFNNTQCEKEFSRLVDNIEDITSKIQ